MKISTLICKLKQQHIKVNIFNVMQIEDKQIIFTMLTLTIAFNTVMLNGAREYKNRCLKVQNHQH